MAFPKFGKAGKARSENPEWLERGRYSMSLFPSPTPPPIGPDNAEMADSESCLPNGRRAMPEHCFFLPMTLVPRLMMSSASGASRVRQYWADVVTLHELIEEKDVNHPQTTCRMGRGYGK